MAVFRPFAAVRPAADMAEQVAALPYDVMSSSEARTMTEGKPWSFLHVDKAEIDLPPGTDLYDDAVYAMAAANLKKMKDSGVLIREDKPCFYLYREIMGGRSQTGVVGCASIDDYLDGTIKKHEFTVAEKEKDRIRHVDVCDANTGIIFLAFRDHEPVLRIMREVTEKQEPVYDFTAEDGVIHQVWAVRDDEQIRGLEEAFGEVPALYIADGHHRTASAVRVGEMRRAAHPGYDGTEEYNFFLAAAFPESELSIWDYNRVVRDLAGMSEEEFLGKIAESFEVTPFPEGTGCSPETYEAVRPAEPHTFSLYLRGRWYLLRADMDKVDASDPVNALDVSILQQKLLSPVLGIGDPRVDRRIAFVGGIRGIGELVKRVDGGEAAAFAMYPTTMNDLMTIADAGGIMPPKSTWFEPKLRSGLLIHELS